MATHSSVLAWRIPWTEKPGRLQSMGSHRVRHTEATQQQQQQQHIYVSNHHTVQLKLIQCFVSIVSQNTKMPSSQLEINKRGLIKKSVIHMVVVQLLSHVRLSLLHGQQPARLLCPWDSPGKSTGVGSHSLLQGIFPTQESKLGLLYCRQILYQLRYRGSP